MDVPPDPSAPHRAPDAAPDRGLRARLGRACHDIASLFAGRDGAGQEGLLAERTLLISRQAPPFGDGPPPDQPPSSTGDGD